MSHFIPRRLNPNTTIIKIYYSYWLRYLDYYVSQIVENSVCTLRNLSYRLEVEMPSSRLLGNQELDTLLGFSSPAKELDYLCWGKRRRGRKRGGWPDDKVHQHRRVGVP